MPFGPGFAEKACSIKIYLTGDPVTNVNVTRLYISPTNTSKLDIYILKKLSRMAVDGATGQVLPHLTLGDFNATAWLKLYHEWTQEDGISGPVDPEIPINSAGGALRPLKFHATGTR